ncbi:MAG: 50S ribosomal protein L22 [Actinobacteria bacterium]|nr:50S ribosomal protein L22 [Actinomycetota bacterium]MBU1943043.1 50S ribosomal protein L22 [Actinomycetota bacterium]MBU2686925.1 50S ribosomal protein L22 [Actinomycetota bacterium]
METRAVARFVRVSPQKARLVVDLIRGKDVGEAQQILEYSPKAAAQIVSKVLMSALANAENNNGLSPEALYVSKVFVDEGPTLKRWRPRAYGRPTRINKRTSHITVILDEREPEKVARRRGLARMVPRRRPKKAAEEPEVEDAPEAPAGDVATEAEGGPEVADQDTAPEAPAGDAAGEAEGGPEVADQDTAPEAPEGDTAGEDDIEPEAGEPGIEEEAEEPGEAGEAEEPEEVPVKEEPSAKSEPAKRRRRGKATEKSEE